MTEVEVEERTTHSVLYKAQHFQARFSDKALEGIFDTDDASKRREKIARRVKARPEAVEIPKGAKEDETDRIITEVLSG